MTSSETSRAPRNLFSMSSLLEPDAPAAAPTLEAGGLMADWRDFVFLHFALAPEELVPYVPYPLELYEGQAFVSLVSFRLERLRPARWLPPALGRFLLRPLSDHNFLNVRTYVRGPAGAGIFFIAEWIDNPLSLLFARLTYGLPYRRADMDRRALPGAGLRRVAVRDRRSGRASHLVIPATAHAPARTALAGSRDAFLLENYIAYTHRRGVGRWFEVRHPRWHAAPFHLARIDATLLEAEYPWFKHATLLGGHLAPGFSDITMSAPRRIPTAPARVAAEVAAPAHGH